MIMENIDVTTGILVIGVRCLIVTCSYLVANRYGNYPVTIAILVY